MRPLRPEPFLPSARTFGDDFTIRLSGEAADGTNPKRPGTAAALRFETVMPYRTVGEARRRGRGVIGPNGKKGGWVGAELRWDILHNYVVIENPATGTRYTWGGVVPGPRRKEGDA